MLSDIDLRYYSSDYDFLRINMVLLMVHLWDSRKIEAGLTRLIFMVGFNGIWLQRRTNDGKRQIAGWNGLVNINYYKVD